MIQQILYIAVGIAVVGGLAIAVWSYIDTRKKYYDDYARSRRK